MNTLQKVLARRRLIVDPGFQVSLVARAMGLCLLVLLAISLGLLWPLVLQPEDNAADPILANDAATVLIYMHHRLWWIVTVCLLLALVLSIRLSHRIAGPLVRFKRHLQTLGEGGLPAPLQTRHGDYLKHEVEILNQTVIQLGVHIDAVRAAQGILSLALESTRTRIAGSGNADTQQSIAEAIAAAELLRARLAVFRHIPATGVCPGFAPLFGTRVDPVSS